MAQRRAETLKVTPAITADYGAPVKAHEVRKPVAVMTAPDGETIYDSARTLRVLSASNSTARPGRS